MKVWNVELEDKGGSCQSVTLEAKSIQLLKQVPSVRACG